MDFCAVFVQVVFVNKQTRQYMYYLVVGRDV